MSDNYVKNVAIVGAGGNSGKFIAEALLNTGKHTVTAISRAESTSQMLDGLQVKRVDYSNHSSLVEALRGQDALVITMSVMGSGQEIKLVEAAAEANVAWILPNEWSPDMANESMSKQMLVGDQKKETRELIVKLGKSSFIAVETGFWYEWSLAIAPAYGFDLVDRAVTFFDEGDVAINTSTWPQVGRAVASLLSLKIKPDGEGDSKASLENFKNDFVYVSSFTVSQQDMFESVLRVTKTKVGDWKVTKEGSHERYAAGQEALKAGVRIGFAKCLYSRAFFPEDPANVAQTKGLSDEMLRLPKEDIDEATKVALQRAEEAKKSGRMFG